ncbi:hypothetical protein SRABI83_01334 [Arthrobacter sp. Bi83]|nr:hypothetical protein SRABI83_01334 [Arthrobacter sp. Bi83]
MTLPQPTPKPMKRFFLWLASWRIELADMERPGKKECSDCGHDSGGTAENLNWLAALNGIPVETMRATEERNKDERCGCTNDAHISYRILSPFPSPSSLS